MRAGNNGLCGDLSDYTKDGIIVGEGCVELCYNIGQCADALALLSITSTTL